MTDCTTPWTINMGRRPARRDDPTHCREIRAARDPLRRALSPRRFRLQRAGPSGRRVSRCRRHLRPGSRAPFTLGASVTGTLNFVRSGCGFSLTVHANEIGAASPRASCLRTWSSSSDACGDTRNCRPCGSERRGCIARQTSCQLSGCCTPLAVRIIGWTSRRSLSTQW
jgi:hypothetical protein